MGFINEKRQAMGSKIATLRERHKMTQLELSVLSGISVGGLRKIEQGKAWPRYETAKAIAGALGEKVDDIMFPHPKLSDLAKSDASILTINRALVDRVEKLESKITPEIESLVDAYLSLKPASRKVLLNTLKKLQKSAG